MGSYQNILSYLAK